MTRQPSSSTTTSSPGRTSRSSSAPTRSSEQVSEATTQSPSSRPSDERPEAVRVAEGDEPALDDRDDRVRALEPGHRVRDRLLERRLVVRDQRGDHLAVGARAQADALRGELLAERVGVGQVAVVPERDRPRPALVDERLRVRPLRRAGRRVAGVADRDLALQALELALVEDLRDEAHVAHRGDVPAVGDGDPGGLLAAVLEREQAEEGDARDVALRRADAEDAAHQTAVPICSAKSGTSAGRAGEDEAHVLARIVDVGGEPAPRGHLGDAPPATPSIADVVRRARATAPPRQIRRISRPLRQVTQCYLAPNHADGVSATPFLRDARTFGTRPTQPTTGVGGIERPSVSL